MSKPNSVEDKKWEPGDQKLLRAARRIIRLYDLEQPAPFAVRAESIAAIIARELNRTGDTGFLRGAKSGNSEAR